MPFGKRQKRDLLSLGLARALASINNSKIYIVDRNVILGKLAVENFNFLQLVRINTSCPNNLTCAK